MNEEILCTLLVGFIVEGFGPSDLAPDNRLPHITSLGSCAS